MFRRIGLFVITNILVVTAIGVIMNLFGINGYLTEKGINYQSLLVVCVLWGFGGSFISLAISKFMAKRAYRMQEIDANDPQIGWINQSVKQYAHSFGINIPEVYVYQSNEVNAFATGPSRNNSLVAVSSGLVHTMSRDEVEGVLGHEVAHIANGDMVTMALAQGVLNAFVMFFSRIVAFAISNALRGDEDEGPGLGPFAHMFLVMALDMVFGMLCMPILMWFSRFREYRADAGSARIVGRDKMISALRKLQQSSKMIDNSEPNLAAFKISGKSSFAELFSSHPSLDKRIAALQSSNTF